MVRKVYWKHASRYVNLVLLDLDGTMLIVLQKVADYIHDVEDFGDLPPSLLLRLGQILSRRRAVTPKTLDLFLRPQYTAIDLFDCASEYIPPHDTRAVLILARIGYGRFPQNTCFNASSDQTQSSVHYSNEGPSL